MKLIKSTILIAVIFLIHTKETEVEGKLFTRCQLAKELIKFDFSRTYLSNWVCLVENESGRSTSKIKELTNQSANYGLFQINSKTYCRRGRKGGMCNMKCEDFLNDDISADVRCAKTIFNSKGFQAWDGWMKKCRSRTLPDVSRC